MAIDFLRCCSCSCFSLNLRRNAQYNASSTMHSYQQHTTTSNANSDSMQLMPYTAQSTKSLNPDELSKLYNMNLYNRSLVSGGVANFPTVQTANAIALGHQPNHTTNLISQMSLAQVNTNPAQYLTSTPYLQQQQQGKLKGSYVNFVYIIL